MLILTQLRNSVLLDLYTSEDSHDGKSLAAYRKGDYKVISGAYKEQTCKPWLAMLKAKSAYSNQWSADIFALYFSCQIGGTSTHTFEFWISLHHKLPSPNIVPFTPFWSSSNTAYTSAKDAHWYREPVSDWVNTSDTQLLVKIFGNCQL